MRLLKIVIADPFWVPLADAIHLTDWQIMTLYVQPQIERQKREQMNQEFGQVPGGARPPEDDSPEAALRALAGLGLLNPVEVEAAIAEKQARDATAK